MVQWRGSLGATRVVIRTGENRIDAGRADCRTLGPEKVGTPNEGSYRCAGKRECATIHLQH